MSLTLVIKGTFKNGKVRTIGTHSSKGVEYKCQFDKEDGMYMGRRAEDTYNNSMVSFNRCIELGKFKSVEMFVEGSFCNNSKEVNNKPFRIEIGNWNGKVDHTKIIPYVNELLVLEILTGDYIIPSCLPNI